jgi:membrane-bound inhibitor of C-type lysozyme
MTRAFAVAALVLGSAATGSALAARGDEAFVVTYRCDGNRWLAVGYPAYRDTPRAPIRLTWEGRTVMLGPARSGSGARYLNAPANLEWWSKGNGGTLRRLDPQRTLLTNCVEA